MVLSVRIIKFVTVICKEPKRMELSPVEGIFSVSPVNGTFAGKAEAQRMCKVLCSGDTSLWRVHQGTVLWPGGLEQRPR